MMVFTVRTAQPSDLDSTGDAAIPFPDAVALVAVKELPSAVRTEWIFSAHT